MQYSFKELEQYWGESEIVREILADPTQGVEHLTNCQIRNSLLTALVCKVNLKRKEL